MSGRSPITFTTKVDYVDDVLATHVNLIQTYLAKLWNTFAFVASSELTIASGSITPTNNYHTVDTESDAASDDLDTVVATGDIEEAFILIIRPDNDARTVVVKHNTGNILCVGNADISLDDAHDICLLMYDDTLSKWIAAPLVGAGGGGGGEANTGSNIGTGGVGVYDQKVGVDLQFKNINAGSSKISVSDDAGNHEIDIDIVEGNLTHNNIGGLTTGDPHTQYVKHSLATAISDFIVSSGAGVFIKKTLAEVKTILGLGSAAYTDSGDYAPASEGVTNGDSHDHSGGDGAQIDHGSLAGLLDDDHTQYQKESEKGAVSGYASLDGSSKVVEDPANATATPTASKIVIADGGGKVDSWVSDASVTVPGKVEIATSAETDTGTDAGRAVSPDGLAGSNFGVRIFGGQLTAAGDGLSIGDGVAYFVVPEAFNGMDITGLIFNVIDPSTSGAISVQIARGRLSSPTSDYSWVDVLSTVLTIDQDEYSSKDAATPYVINTSNDDILTGDVLRIDLDGVGVGADLLIGDIYASLP